MTLPYVEQFPLLILRRSPVASRPPANYRRAFVGRYYEVWRRTGSPKVARHLPLGGVNDAGRSRAARRSGGSRAPRRPELG